MRQGAFSFEKITIVLCLGIDVPDLLYYAFSSSAAKKNEIAKPKSKS